MSDVLMAIGLGALSAASLPLGAVTARLWHPTDRILGVLTAFGAGALLAAVTVGIVAPVAEEGELVWLVGGAVAGGLAFELLNREVNEKGGFLRKASTAMGFAQQRQRSRTRRLLRRLEAVELFDGLPDRELELLLRAGTVVAHPAGHPVYRSGDPAGSLGIVVSGEVRVEGSDGTRQLITDAPVGYRSFLTGTAHRTAAVAVRDSDVLRIPRAAFVATLSRTPELRRRLQARLVEDDLIRYLREEHGLGDAEIERWNARVAIDGGHGRVRASLAGRAGADFVERADEIRRLPVFSGLPGDELTRISVHLIRKRHEAGHVFFRRGEVPDRLYILDEGEVRLVDEAGGRRSESLTAGDAFGSLSFLTGGLHTTTAIAATPVTVWVLRRRELPGLLEALPRFREAVHAFLEQSEVSFYLEQRQGFEPARAQAWLHAAVQSVDEAGPLPEVQQAAGHHAAPVAIWLGLMLDGIPESFVIGARTGGGLGVSLIAGLFLSNYPEALSSSVGMREQGTTWRRIATMWLSLVAAAAVGAGIGAVVFSESSEAVSAVLEGITAGAMLTVISETMLPEAYARSGHLSGPASLAGFLITLLFGA